MSYDPKCYDLADEFLDDFDTQKLHSHANADELAQRIQNVIEDFIAEKGGK